GAAVHGWGYGPLRRGEERSAGVLRRAVFTAAQPFGPSRILLWIDARRAGVCPGDSGGPLAGDDGRVIAASAWGGTGGDSGCIGAAQGVLLAPQRGWIDQTLAGWGAEARWSP